MDIWTRILIKFIEYWKGPQHSQVLYTNSHLILFQSYEGDIDSITHSLGVGRMSQDTVLLSTILFCVPVLEDENEDSVNQRGLSY
jgi:hypothetical protein